jgi:hypothetical protein
MTGLEIAGLVAFCIFVASYAGLLVTSTMKLFNSNLKVLDFLFTVSAVAFVIAGFSVIAISIVNEFVR